MLRRLQQLRRCRGSSFSGGINKDGRGKVKLEALLLQSSRFLIEKVDEIAKKLRLTRTDALEILCALGYERIQELLKKAEERTNVEVVSSK
jgi:hypothetical protein